MTINHIKHTVNIIKLYKFLHLHLSKKNKKYFKKKSETFERDAKVFHNYFKEATVLTYFTCQTIVSTAFVVRLDTIILTITNENDRLIQINVS